MKKTCLIFLSLIFSIQMNAQVTAAFIYADLKDTVICDTAPMVEVMDQSTGGVTSWLWEIWDQQWTFVTYSSTLQNPVLNTFADAEYSSNHLRLIVSNGTDSDTLIQEYFVHHIHASDASWWSSASDSFGLAGLPVYFTNNTSNTWELEAQKFEWDFGDGVTSTDMDPVHTYAAPGTYPVSLTAYVDTVRALCVLTAAGDVLIADSLSGIAENKNLSFSVFPNPAADHIQIQAREKIQACTVQSMDGRCVYTASFVSDKIRIDLGAWPGGVYLLSVMGSNSTGRIIFIKN